MIVTTAEVKRYLNIDTSDTSQDTLISELISRAEAKIGNLFGGNILGTDYADEIYDFSQILFTQHYPIISVTSLYLRNSLLVENEDFYVYPTYINFTFDTEAKKAVKISYRAGFQPVPDDIKQAIILTASNFLKINVDLQPQQIEDTRLTREVKELLEPYLRIII